MKLSFSLLLLLASVTQAQFLTTDDTSNATKFLVDHTDCTTLGQCVAGTVSIGTPCNSDDDCSAGETCNFTAQCVGGINGGEICDSDVDCTGSPVTNPCRSLGVITDVDRRCKVSCGTEQAAVAWIGGADTFSSLVSEADVGLFGNGAEFLSISSSSAAETTQVSIASVVSQLPGGKVDLLQVAFRPATIPNGITRRFWINVNNNHATPSVVTCSCTGGVAGGGPDCFIDTTTDTAGCSADASQFLQVLDCSNSVDGNDGTTLGHCSGGTNAGSKCDCGSVIADGSPGVCASADCTGGGTCLITAVCQGGTNASLKCDQTSDCPGGGTCSCPNRCVSASPGSENVDCTGYTCNGSPCPAPGPITGAGTCIGVNALCRPNLGQTLWLRADFTPTDSTLPGNFSALGWSARFIKNH